MTQDIHSNGIPGSAQREQDEPGIPDDMSKSASTTEAGGRGGLDPTRYGDWEKNGRCIDF